RWTARPARSASGRPSAPRQATAMARSNAEPALGSEAGERLTVRRRASQGSPQDVTAARTRSRASDSDASGRPTRMKAGSPLAACASTWTRCPSTPTSATDHVRARPTSAHRPQVLDEGGAPVPAQHRDDVDAHLGGPGAVLAQPAPGQPPQPLELDGAHGLGRVAEPGTAAGLDLDERDGAGPRVAGDDVDLALAAAPVAVEDLVAVLAEHRCGDALATGAELVLRGHGAPPPRPASPTPPTQRRARSPGGGQARREPALWGKRGQDGRLSSARGSSSTLTSLKVTTRTERTKRADR